MALSDIPPETKQERIEDLILAVWPALQVKTSRMKAAEVILKCIDAQSKVGGGGDAGEQVVIGLPEVDKV